MDPLGPIGFLLTWVLARYFLEKSQVYIFFALNGIVFLFYIILMWIQESCSLSQQVRNKLDSLCLALLGPAVLCIAFTGAIYTIIDISQTPFAALAWLLITIGLHFPISKEALQRFKAWWHYYKNKPKAFLYYPKRNFNEIGKEFIENGEDEDEMKGISAGLVRADWEQRDRSFKKEKAMREKACSVCNVDFEIGQKVVDMPGCLHTVHEQCIDNWYWGEKGESCPTCTGTIGKTDIWLFDPEDDPE